MTYEYQCNNCGHKFEVMQKMSDSPIRTCPKCGKEVKRIITGGVGFILQGTGWTPKSKK